MKKFGKKLLDASLKALDTTCGEVAKLAKSPTVQAIAVGGGVALAASTGYCVDPIAIPTGGPTATAIIDTVTGQVYPNLGPIAGASAGIFGFRWVIHTVKGML
jgi:hypothetical protein